MSNELHAIIEDVCFNVCGRGGVPDDLVPWLRKLLQHKFQPLATKAEATDHPAYTPLEAVLIKRLIETEELEYDDHGYLCWPGSGARVVERQPVAEALSTHYMVSAVEEDVGMGHSAWDCVDPRKIIQAAILIGHASIISDIEALEAAVEGGNLDSDTAEVRRKELAAVLQWANPSAAALRNGDSGGASPKTPEASQ